MEFEVHVIVMEACKNAQFPLPMTLKNLDRASEYYILTDIKTGKVSKLAKFSDYATIRVHEIVVKHNENINVVSLLMLAATEVVLKSVNNLPNSTIKKVIVAVGDKSYYNYENEEYKGYMGLILQY